VPGRKIRPLNRQLTLSYQSTSEAHQQFCVLLRLEYLKIIHNSQRSYSTMAPATIESASPIGIANVSSDRRLFDGHDTNQLSRNRSSLINGMETPNMPSGHFVLSPTDNSTDTRSLRSEELPSQLWYAYNQSIGRGAGYTDTSQVAGESGLGKTTFINTLFSTTIKNYADHRRRHQKQIDKTVEIEITKAELEEKFFKGMIRLSQNFPLLTGVMNSPPDRHRHTWLRRLRQQPRLMDAYHRVPGRSA